MTWQDVRMVLRLIVLGVEAWIVPESAWRPLRRIFLDSGGRQPFTELRQQTVEPILGRPLSALESRELAYRFAAGSYDDTLRVLRSYRPSGWQPDIALEGESNLRRALDRGKGAVLWVAWCGASRLTVKMALFRAGFAVHHLSRPSHGFAATDFSIRYLNRYWQAIENRFLAERIVMTNANSIGVMRRFKMLLKDNQIVSITDHAKARQRKEVVFLNGFRSLATGPANLALSSGSDLLPVVCRECPDGTFRVTIAPPLADDAERTRESLIHHYSNTLAAFVARYPYEWSGWWWDPDIRPAKPREPLVSKAQPLSMES